MQRGLVLLLLAVSVHAIEFSANFRAWNLEGRANAGGIQFPYVDGVIRHKPTDIQIQYNVPASGSQPASTISTFYNTVNLPDGSRQFIRRKHCSDSGRCISDTISAFPNFDSNSAGWAASANVDGGTTTFTGCRQNNNAGLRPGLDPRIICSNGGTITFIEIFSSNTRFALSSFSGTSPAVSVPGTCGNPTCNAEAEIVFVVDSSGSIDGTEWNQQNAFITEVVRAFDVGPNTVRVGFSYFGRNVQIYDLTGDINTILGLASSGRPGSISTGATNIEAGMDGAVTVLNRATRRNVQRLVILLTDGECNAGGCNLAAAQNRQAAAGFTSFFAVGVDAAAERQLLEAAGCAPDVNNNWNTIAQCTAAGGRNGNAACFCPLKVTAFGGLTALRNQLVTTTCATLPTVTDTCNCFSGLCGCDGTFSDCRCPTCDDGTLCTNDACNNANGLCSFTPKTITDNNVCTADSCAPGTGLVTNAPQTCAQLGFPDDNNICTQAVCTPLGGCFNNDTCTTRAAPPCFEWKCTNPSAGTFAAGCTLEPKNCGGCFQDNNCYLDSDPSDCVPKVCPKAACKVEECDANIVCNQALNASCNCIHKPKDCSGTPCRPGRCDLGSDSCVFDIFPCDDNDACTTDSCTVTGPSSFSCSNVPITCNDNSLCTADTCSPATGCVYTPVACTDESVCRPAKCDPTKGCIVTVRNCTQEMLEAGQLAACKVAGCSDTYRVGKAVVEGRQFDAIFPPGCFVDLSQALNESDDCPKDANGEPVCPTFKEDECGVCNGDGSTCGINLSIAEAAGIAAGALAGIIIACIIACVIISGIGGKVGLDYYRKYQGTMGPSQNNPLYQGKEAGGTNPFYEEGQR